MIHFEHLDIYIRFAIVFSAMRLYRSIEKGLTSRETDGSRGYREGSQTETILWQGNGGDAVERKTKAGLKRKHPRR
jgi:hypothetical protein